MLGVYVTYVANGDEGQRHVVTLVWPFKEVHESHDSEPQQHIKQTMSLKRLKEHHRDAELVVK